MSQFIQQFFSSQIDSDPIQHIYRLETTTLFDDKLTSISKLVTLSANKDYDGFFLSSEKDHLEKSGSQLHGLVLNRLVNLLVQDVENESLAENYITILLNVISRVVSKKEYQSKIALLFQNVNFIPILVASLNKKSPFVLKNTLSLFRILYDYDHTVAFQLMKSKGLSYMVTLLKNSTTSESIDAEFMYQVNELILQFLKLITSKNATRTLNQMEKTQQEEIMKFLVFEEIYQVLMGIIEHLNEDLKVLALELICNLVSKSESNQRIFIQSQYMSNLLSRLSLPSMPRNEISTLARRLYIEYKVFNHIRLLILKILDMLLSSQLDLMTELISSFENVILTNILYLALMKDIKAIITHTQSKEDYANSTSSDWNVDYIEEIQIESLKVLGKAFEASNIIQRSFVGMHDLIFEDEFLCCALVRLVRMSIYSPIEKIQSAALKTLLQFVHNNEEGQYMVATTYRLKNLNEREKTESGLSCGITLTEALLSHQPQSASLHASEIFVNILQQNPNCEIVLLEKPFDDSVNPPISFFDTLLKELFKGLRDADRLIGKSILISQLKFVCQFLNNSGEACRRFMHISGGPIFILDFYKGMLSPDFKKSENERVLHIRGLITLLIGLLAMYFPNESSVSTSHVEMGQITKKSLHDIIFRKIGYDRLEQEFVLLNNLIDQEESTQYYSLRFITLVKIWKETILSYLRKPEEERLSSFDIKALKEKLSKEYQDQINQEKQNFDTKLSEIQVELQSRDEKIKKLEKECDDYKESEMNLRNEIQILQKEAARVSEIDTLTQEIQTLKKNHEENFQIQQSSIQNLQQQLAQKQSELSKLTDVYNMMDSEHDDELEDLRKQNKSLKKQMQSLEKQKQDQADIIQRLNDENIRNHMELSKKSNISNEEFEEMKAKFENDIHDLKSNFVDEINTLQGKIDTFEKDRESLISAIGQKDQQVMTMQQYIQTLEGKVYEKTMQATEQQNIIGELYKEMENKNSAIAQLENQLQEAKKSLSIEEQHAMIVNSEQYQQVIVKISELQEQVESLHKELNAKDSKIQELETDNEDLMQIVEMLENKNE